MRFLGHFSNDLRVKGHAAFMPANFSQQPVIESFAPTKPATGKIAKLLFGQAYGFIKMRDNREVYFHRADVQEGTSFNDLEVGETVKFELLDDAVSGARALRVRRNKSR